MTLRSAAEAKTHLRRVLLFLSIGGASAAVDLAVLAVSREVLHVSLPTGTCLGLSAAFLVNFTLNRRLFGGVGGATTAQLGRYLAAVIVNYALTIALVTTLALLLHYLMAKLLALAVCALLNYWLYGAWVFAERSGR